MRTPKDAKDAKDAQLKAIRSVTAPNPRDPSRLEGKDTATGCG
ncbi:hypothetical protein JOC86_001638 [Bacillus pakistanensis]|uniref:Uncharacterized protein n=1 Tax=Rossellomorea pakistanensis TaxID=992288 RepID=A0ABS2NB66_9BACI|nr:hypothetical protein [Bacillus pakistanensis]MBM7585096.1 hypothetical protein [Bacillus pakistanensis]